MNTSILDIYNDVELAKKLLDKISDYKKPYAFMEVCGTHTVSILKTGIKNALPKNIKLISGPGCPVCVTSVETVEKAIIISEQSNIVLFCFGDMLKVPGITHSLSDNSVAQVMYTPMAALEYARENPSKQVVLFGVGFETTIPLFASVILRAKKENINNLFLLSDFKVLPPALEALLNDENFNIDGFILPGHVSAIIGSDIYSFVSEKYKIPGVITGFEIVDILGAILMLLDMLETKNISIKNQYMRLVNNQGNLKALDIIYQVFEPDDSLWRGLGKINNSGLKLKKDFMRFDIEKYITFNIPEVKKNNSCICGDIIKGIKEPVNCNLFGLSCTPNFPIGPCMVSQEGTCAAWYKYSLEKGK